MRAITQHWNERTLGILLVLIGLGGLGVSGWNAMASSPDDDIPPRTACRVLTVYDGDTVGCDLNGDGRIQRPEEAIRLLGVDTPEMHYSRKNPTFGTAHPVDEPFAPEASHYTTQMTLGRVLYLEFDQYRTDRYGRTLAYPFFSPTAREGLGEQLLALGYGRVLFIGANRRYETRYNAIEQQARAAHRGLWGLPHP